MNPVEIFQGRYACKHYDPERDVPEEVFGRIIEAARLTPSAMNVQPWHIYVFDRASKAKLRPAIRDFNLERFDGCSKAILISSMTKVPDSYLEEITAREEEDGRYAGAPEIKNTVDRARKAYVAAFKGEKLTGWTGKQTYIMLGYFLLAAACEQVDATPVEGFVPSVADELLDLKSRNETSQLVVLLGYRKNDGNADRPKSRLPLDRIVTKF
ncbi:MAG: nitroreductase family protein [Lachnospiraceae bacterium]|jgi:nitroreductase/dihydropteridine reductase|nr:nitroreductase family protein [Lachnospiraceae bacterium]